VIAASVIISLSVGIFVSPFYLDWLGGYLATPRVAQDAPV
jgi:hypothetical protein